MPTLATVEDIKARWLGTEPLPADPTIQAWLDDAETLIFSEYPDLLARLDADEDGHLHRNVVYVEVQLASQALKNPDGVRQRARTAGTFTDSVTYGTETLQSVLTLTPAHRAMLAGTRTRHTGIDMTEHHPAQNPLANAWVNGPHGYAPGGK